MYRFHCLVGAIALPLVVILHAGCATMGTKLPGRAPTQAEAEQMHRSRDCAKTGTLSATDRHKRYPFSDAKEIQVVSFKASYDSVWHQYSEASLPRNNDTIVYSKLHEIKTLSEAEVDTLSNLIYNYGFQFSYKPKRKNVYFIGTVNSCYNPRNAILFVNSENRVFDFIEICFECQRSEASSSLVGLGVNCNQKMDLIREFFKSAGVKYGIEGNYEEGK